ncbi:MAG: hypothetical protein FJ033_08675 [Chloroflexi bacterium]|nr:hypothetical protein [Chloroflexota bacterium]
MDTAHLIVGRAAVYFVAICGIWGLLACVLPSLPRDGRYYGTLLIGEGLLILQFALGLGLVFAGRLPPDLLHFAYGGLATLVLPLVYSWSRGREASSPLPTALAALFIAGLAIRAFTTSAAGLGGLFGPIPP